MTFRLLLSVYYDDDFRGQCLPEITVENWNGFNRLIAPESRANRILDWSLCAPIRDVVIKVAGINPETQEDEMSKITALIVQIIPV